MAELSKDEVTEENILTYSIGDKADMSQAQTASGSSWPHGSRSSSGTRTSRPLSIFVGFVVIIVILQLITQGTSRFPTFISPVNLLNILQQVGVPGIIAVGMTIVMISGGIDLSVGMLASLVSIITASGISKWHLGVVGSIVAGVLAAVVLETLMGSSSPARRWSRSSSRWAA